MKYVVCSDYASRDKMFIFVRRRMLPHIFLRDGFSEQVATGVSDVVYFDVAREGLVVGGRHRQLRRRKGNEVELSRVGTFKLRS